MKGKTIYITKREMQALIKTLDEWQDFMIEKNDHIYIHRMREGLGNLWEKMIRNAKQEDKQ